MQLLHFFGYSTNLAYSLTAGDPTIHSFDNHTRLAYVPEQPIEASETPTIASDDIPLSSLTG